MHCNYVFFTFRLEFFGGSLYYFHPVAGITTWSKSESFCNNWFDGHLTSLHSQQEFDFIV